jgi:phosphonate transport system substrate-binding protein
MASLGLAGLLTAGVSGQVSDDDTPLRLGVVSSYNPRLMFVKYQPLVDYLSERTERRWELAVSKSYEDAVDELCTRRVALAYLGPLSYVRAHDHCGAEPLAQLRKSGGDVFYADVLVRADSPFERLEDLAGQRFGFGDVLSASSHLVPRAMLQEAGLEPGRDVQCLYFDQHERAAHAVLMGEAEACGVRDLVGEAFLHRGLRRLARSGPIPAHPFVVTPDCPAPLRRALVAALLQFPAGTRPRRAEERWDPELTGGFGPAVDSDFDPIRRLAARVFGPSAATRSTRELRCR